VPRGFALLVPLTLLGGCWLTDAELQDKLGVSDDTGDDGPITVSTIEPLWGTAAGGTDVTISAGPIGEGVIVRFGDATASIISVQSDQVVVRTPAGAVGKVDVDVQWGAHAGSAPQAFEYFTDGTGTFGAIGTVNWIDLVGFLDFAYEDGGSAWVNLTERSTYDYQAFYGASLDTCASGWSFPGNVVEVAHANEVHLSRDGGSGLLLPWDSVEDAYFSDLVSEGTGSNAWISNGVLDLEPLDVPDFPAISAKAFVRTPSAFAVFVTCDTCSSAPLDDPTWVGPTAYQDDFQVEWTTSAPGDYVLIRVDRYGDNDEVVEQVRCLVHDDGAFTIPAATWQASTGVTSIDLWVGRARASTAVLPHDNSKSGVAGVYWIVGTAGFVPM